MTVNNESSSDECVELERLRDEVCEYKRWVEIMTQVAEAGSMGDLEQRVVACDSLPDLIKLANSVNRVLDVSDAFVRESSAALSCAAKGKYYRRVMLSGLQGSYYEGARLINQASEQMSLQAIDLQNAKSKQIALAEVFENQFIEMVANVASAATHLQGTSVELATAATHATNEASEVSRISGESTQNVRNAMQATTGFEKSLLAVEDNVSQSNTVSKEAVANAETASDIIEGLTDASSNIGKVVRIISQVADQTNLLALNATIEAARAGDAGKGFAVVASEVKNLANQTGRATQQITEDIKAVQGETAKAVEAINTIGRTINDMKSVSGDIVQSVDEQKTANHAISHDMRLTEKSCTEVTERIRGVFDAADKTNVAAESVLQSAATLTELAELLNTTVEDFLVCIREGNPELE